MCCVQFRAMTQTAAPHLEQEVQVVLPHAVQDASTNNNRRQAGTGKAAITMHITKPPAKGGKQG